jgi:hypothetical protein
LEKKIIELELEIEELKKAIESIDKVIVSKGFKRLNPLMLEKSTSPSIENKDNRSIISKDGVLLGKIEIKNKDLIFKPVTEYNFTEDISPFNSFLITRVLENMRNADQQRASNGEIESENILEYDVSTINGKIVSLLIKNFGGEPRLQEINSSLRWTFDKMHDKLKKNEKT